MRGYAAIALILRIRPQLMLKGFCIGLQRRFRHIVDWVSGRIGDPLLRADNDDHARLLARKHRRQKCPHAQHWPKQVHVHRPAPFVQPGPMPAPNTCRRVVDQNGALAKPRRDRFAQLFNLPRVGDIRGHAEDRLAATR